MRKLTAILAFLAWIIFLFLCFAIFSGHLTANGWQSGATVFDGTNLVFRRNALSLGEAQQPEHADAIRSVRIKAGNAIVRVIGQEGGHLSVSTSGSNGSDFNLERPSNDLLVVNGNSRWHFFAPSAQVEIRVPKDQLRSLELKLDAGTVVLKNFNVEKSQLDIDAGTLSASKCELGDLKLDSDAGTVTAEKCSVNSLQLDVDAGTATLGLREVRRRIDVDCDAGTVELFLPASGQYHFDLRHDIGSINNALTNSDAADAIPVRVHCDVGSISLQPLK